MIISCSVLLRRRNVSHKIAEKIKTHTLYSMAFFFENRALLWDIVEKYCRARLATDDNTVRRMLKGYKHTLYIQWRFSSKIVPFYEILWRNIVEPGWPQMIIQYGACWRATNTHSEYVILIAFPLQQWFHERASMLRYTYINLLGHIYVASCMQKFTV